MVSREATLVTADQVLLHLLAAGCPLTVRRLAEGTGRARAGIWEVLGALQRQGYVEQVGSQPCGLGRPEALFEAIPGRGTYLGVAISGDIARRCEMTPLLTDMRARPIVVESILNSEDRRRRLPNAGPRAVVRAIDAEIRDLQDKAPRMYRSIRGVGVCLGGHVNQAEGLVASAPHLRWSGLTPLAQMLEDACGLPVVLENDCNAIARWESAFGIHRRDRFALVLVGEGVGASLVTDGQVFTGASGGAGEIGHMVAVDRGGDLCVCGKQGCLETVVSYRAIRKSAEKAGLDTDSSVHAIVELAEGRDKRANNVLQRAGRALGRAIASLTALVDPGSVIISSTALEQSSVFRRAVESAIASESPATMAPLVLWAPTSYNKAASGVAWTVISRNPRASPLAQ
jgi:predicted NBD/HSP70 family sugar kinase